SLCWFALFLTHRVALLLVLFLHRAGHSRRLHSFPTRRSSDLLIEDGAAGPAGTEEEWESAAEPETVTYFEMPRSWYLYGALSLADRKSTRLNSSHVSISYAVFCLKKKKEKIEAAVKRERIDKN